MAQSLVSLSPRAKPGPIVFLDRDGTIIEHIPYLGDPTGVILLPGTAEGLRTLQTAGRRLVVVTNQSGIGRGYFTEAAMHAVNARMCELLAAEGVHIDAIYWCPHQPEAGCTCRKPEPGLVQRAVQDLGGHLAGAVVVGDSPCDIALAQRLGLRSVLICAANHAARISTGQSSADWTADNLAEAARLILAR